MISIFKPRASDLKTIERILLQWNKKKDARNYIQRIVREIKGKTEFNMRFWAVKKEGKVVGITGLSDPLPKVLPLAKTKNPGEIKILYLDNNFRGLGIGKKVVKFLEKEARERGYSELLARSVKKYKETAYGFYERVGYLRLGSVLGGKGTPMAVFGKVL